MGGALYGDINYTEPLLNNLHFIRAMLDYFRCASSHSHNAGSA